MKKIYLTAILLSIIQYSFACSCSYFFLNDVISKDLLEHSDVLIIGHPIKNIDSDFISPNLNYMGTMILFKVDSLIKGELRSDTIFINQETMGNCAQNFIPNETYVIFGNQIKKYETVDINDHYSTTGYIKKNETLKFRDTNFLLTTFETLTKKYYTITTNQCISFSSQSLGVSNYFNLNK